LKNCLVFYCGYRLRPDFGSTFIQTAFSDAT